MIWRPNPGPQENALRSIAYETLYGGARGGGKTDAGLMWLIRPQLIQNPRYRALVIRRNADDLSDWVDRARVWYTSLGAEIVGKPPEMRFPSGAKIRTGHLKDDSAYTKYQGHEYQRILIEELTQIPQEKHYLQLLGSCRSTVSGIDARIFCTTNPGNVGHGWVKRRFIDPAPWGIKFVGSDTRRYRIFIHAKVEDNPVLMEADPNYIHYLEGLKDTDVELYKAWRLGDWDTFAGQYFREFRRDLHVVPRFTPPDSFIKIGGLDWGRAAPFAFLSSYVERIEWVTKDGDTVPFYRVITYNEVYGTEKTPKEWAEIIKGRVGLSEFRWIQADNQIFNPGNDNSVSIHTQFYQADERFRSLLKPASKDRVGGWENLHNWLSIAPDGKPYWQITDNCINLIRTLPELVHDDTRVEDVDTESEDHAPDAVRYMFKALKWIDAKVGGVNGRDRNKYPRQMQLRAPNSLDLDRFATSIDKERDWRTI